VAAAAGIGTVAAMLGSAVPANAAGPTFVLDPTYGGLNGAPRGVAVAGLPSASGVDAKNVTVASVNYRYVLSQNSSGTPVAFLSRFDAAGRPDNTFGASGRVSLTGLPVGATVSKLLVDASNNLYVVAQSGLNVVIAQYSTAGVQATSGWGTAGIATIATGLPSGSTVSIVDAKWQTITSNNGILVALNGQATGAATTGAWIVRVTSAGALDTTGFNAGGGTPGVWPVAVGGVSALSVGGISPRSAADTTTPTHFFVAATLPPEANTSNDTQSAVIDAVAAAAVAPTSPGVIEPYADTAGWSYEQIGDIAPLGTGTTPTYLVSGRTGTGYFVARLTNAGTGLDTTFGINGVSSLIPASCTTGMPQLAQDATTNPLIYLAVDRTCASNMPEIVRLTNNGQPDTGFNQGSAIWSPNIPVNAKPLMATGTGATAALNFGSMASAGNDAASAQAIPTTAPTAGAVTVVSGGAVVSAGQQVTLYSAPGGTPAPNIQWQWAGYGSSTWQNIPDATGPYYSFRAMLNQSGYQYRAIATNQYGVSSSPTAAQSITVVAGAPTISTQPQNQTVSAGSPVSFTVAWAGEPESTVQWQASANNGGSWANITGATKATLTLPNPPLEYNGFQYRAVVTNPNGTVNSNPATLLVTPPAILITKQPTDQHVNEGDDATFSVGANGNGALTYQWQWSKTGADNSFTNVPGATSASWTWHNVKAEDAGTVVQVKITDVANNVEYSGKATLSVKGATGGHAKARGDYDGDGKTDIATFTPSTGAFNWAKGSQSFGRAGDIPMVGNYDPSDDAADMTVFRPSDGTWRVDGNAPVPFGRSTDRPVAGDFNGDGTSDPAVFRPSSATWYVKGMDPVAFGRPTDIPVAGDYNGDGKTDIAVYRPSSGTWYFLGGSPVAFGRSTDTPLMGDWNGDGKADVAVYRPSSGTWYVSGGAAGGTAFGRSTDIPLSGDFNGDGKTDVAVFRPSNTTWYFMGGDSVQFGKPGDWPLPRS
jgi:hypothetical protein